ncbi:two-pore potassium channel 5-like [Rosa rugosa]|uniref:two-pore potassium channel 5-like n=1 Tax=Rosa rugosa TaxID=74645 RepID=UPI002B409C50|nr:two-pore potassium channel 5-like [Rosa rugosa]
MAVMRDLKPKMAQVPKPQSEISSIIRPAVLLLVMYLSLGVVIYSFNRDKFSGTETHPVIDALYFCIVTMCTIGYGDIAPETPLAKVFSCVSVLVGFGFGFIDILHSGVVNYVLDLQENIILTGIQMSHHHHHDYVSTICSAADVIAVSPSSEPISTSYYFGFLLL